MFELISDQFVVQNIDLNWSLIFTWLLVVPLTNTKAESQFFADVLIAAEYLFTIPHSFLSQQLTAVLLSVQQKNGTHEGEFVFHTGEQNYLDYGKIDTWNGLR